MKYVNNGAVKILISVAIGLLLAAEGTKITYTCAPIDNAAGCASFEKAIMHPYDLLHDRQNSLVHFSETFIVGSLACFAAISIYGWVQKRKIGGRPTA